MGWIVEDGLLFLVYVCVFGYARVDGRQLMFVIDMGQGWSQQRRMRHGGGEGKEKEADRGGRAWSSQLGRQQELAVRTP